MSGSAALLLELQGEGGPDAIRAALEGTSRDLGAPGPDALFGRGQIDLCEAAAQLRPGAPGCP